MGSRGERCVRHVSPVLSFPLLVNSRPLTLIHSPLSHISLSSRVSIPVFVRPNSVLPLGPKGSLKPDYDYTSGLTLQAYQLAEGAVHEVKLPSGKGPEIAATLKVSKGSSEGEALKVEVVEGKLAGDVKSLAF